MIRRIFAVVFCLAIALATADAQSNYAVVRGSILDPQHRPVAGAHIAITASGTLKKKRGFPSGKDGKPLSSELKLFHRRPDALRGATPSVSPLAVLGKASQEVSLKEISPLGMP